MKTTDKKWCFTESEKAFAFFPVKFPVDVVDADLELLHRTSCELGGKNGRLCLHESESSKIHHMIVLEHARYFYSPHYHEDDAECFMLMDGRLGLLTFSNDGEVDSAQLLVKHEFCKVGRGVVHAVFPASEYCIYYESKGGPFVPNQSSLIPSWAPTTGHEIARYKNNVSRMLQAMK